MESNAYAARFRDFHNCDARAKHALHLDVELFVSDNEYGVDYAWVVSTIMVVVRRITNHELLNTSTHVFTSANFLLLGAPAIPVAKEDGVSTITPEHFPKIRPKFFRKHQLVNSVVPDKILGQASHREDQNHVVMRHSLPDCG